MTKCLTLRDLAANRLAAIAPRMSAFQIPYNNKLPTLQFQPQLQLQTEPTFRIPSNIKSKMETPVKNSRLHRKTPTERPNRVAKTSRRELKPQERASIVTAVIYGKLSYQQVRITIFQSNSLPTSNSSTSEKIHIFKQVI